MTEPLLQFDNVTLGYGRGAVLSGLSFAVGEGEFMGIVGPNGSGKTTLLRAILGTLRPRSGTITRARINGRDHRIRFGYVPQSDSVNDMCPLTVRDIVLMGRFSLLGLFRRAGRSDCEAALACLRAVDLADLEGAEYRNLSGGQQQRVLIARALASEPHVLILDEPTNGMDLPSEHAIMELVRSLHAQGGRTILMVTHMLNLVANYAHRLALLAGGGLVVGATDAILNDRELERLYGVGICVREVDGRRLVMARGAHPGEAASATAGGEGSGRD